MPDSDNRRLDSWKAIAHYLDRDVRTVMRWEKSSGMPVHRVPGTRRGRSVFAYSKELDGWLAEGAPVNGVEERAPAAHRDAPHTGAGRRVLVPAMLAVLAALAWAAVARPAGGFLRGVLGSDPVAALPIVNVRASGNVIVARDVDDRIAWTFDHPRNLGFETEGLSRIVDLVAAPGDELVVAANAVNPAQPTFLEGELYAFAHDGSSLWDLRLDRSLYFGAGRFSGPWVSLSLDALVVGGQPKIAWAVHHYTWWPSMLSLIDRTGAVEGTFVNSGWITETNSLRTAAGDMLLAGGISNSRASAMLAVLDGRDISGSSPEEPGSMYACGDCPPGRPLRYFLFPPTEVNRAHGLPYNEVIKIEVTSRQFNVTVFEGPTTSDVAWVYEFGHDFELLRAIPGDSYWSHHRLLRLDGKIDHNEDQCPERAPPPVRMWTRAGGWVDLFLSVHP